MNRPCQAVIASRRVNGVGDYRVARHSAERLVGAFATADAAADVMARWVVRSKGDRVLEPAFGDGAFLRAISGADVQLFGAELLHELFAAAIAGGLLPATNAHFGDFLALEPFEVEAIVGNPPYVRLRHLPREQVARALRAAESVLGQPMEPSGSVWMPFVLHALRFLRRGGRMALVLPHEFTYVRYARPLWRLLGESFADLRVVRVHERLFPEILQEVVVLFADGFGGSTPTVRYQTLERAPQFAAAEAAPFTRLSIAEIAGGRRAFVEALLPAPTRSLLATVLAESTGRMTDVCTFRIGYVTGDKKFFHPSESVILDFDLPASHLRPALTSGRQIRSCGLHTSNPRCVPERLYIPSAKLTPGDLRYIARGEADGLDKRYKCAVREPWYVVPSVPVPDVVLSVFAERPVLAINDAGYVASNSLLCGYLRKGTPDEFAAGWYTSLTLLQCELQVHALGGGVLILIPGEVARIRVPTCRSSKAHLRAIDELLASGDLEGAYRRGDEAILRRQLGFSAADVERLRAGIEVLRHWRNSANGAATPAASRRRATAAGSG